jgi:hypothetical protein
MLLLATALASLVVLREELPPPVSTLVPAVDDVVLVLVLVMSMGRLRRS